MKKNYLLPLRVFLLVCVLLSSGYISGQNVSPAKISLQSSKIRSPLPNNNYSSFPEPHRKDLSLKVTNKIDTARIKLNVADPAFQQAKVLPKNIVFSGSAKKLEIPVHKEKGELAPFRNRFLLPSTRTKENATP